MKPFRLSPETLRLIKRYAADRRNAAAIAGLLGCSAVSIETICLNHGIELVKEDGAVPLSRCRRARSMNGTTVIEVAIDNAALDVFRHEATRRGCKPATLISRLAEIVAMDGLFKALLEQ